MVDTSAIYALLDKSDANHVAAVKLIKIIARENNEVILTNFIVAETHALILVRLGNKLANYWLKNLCWHIERVSEEDEEKAKDIIDAYIDKKFSYTDATTFAVMTRINIKTAFTFDKHFIQYGFKMCGIN
jgi:predicted nucleic acid-binding protein